MLPCAPPSAGTTLRAWVHDTGPELHAGGAVRLLV